MTQKTARFPAITVSFGLFCSSALVNTARFGLFCSSVLACFVLFPAFCPVALADTASSGRNYAAGRAAGENAASVMTWILGNIGFILLGVAALILIVMVIAAKRKARHQEELAARVARLEKEHLSQLSPEEYRKEIHRAFVAQERAKLSDSLRYDILCRDGFRCQICGATQQDGYKLHVDHIVPVSKGGRTEPGNLRTLCERCNMGKSDKIERVMHG